VEIGQNGRCHPPRFIKLERDVDFNFRRPVRRDRPGVGQFTRPAFQFHVHIFAFDGNGQHPADGRLARVKVRGGRRISKIIMAMMRERNNQLTGSIPPELGSLSNCWDFRLANNQLTGSIPSELGDLSNLWTLDLERNLLTGNIPPELGNLSNLEWFQLFDNQLTGSIPPELGNLNDVWRLDLAANQLTGAIPPELGNLNNINSLWLFNNQLTGNIPPELGNLTNLGGLYLSNNQLTGSIPPELSNLSNLGYLYLGSNNLVGNVPTELSNLSNLDTLLLNGNQLSGPLPQSLVSLSLTRFYFNDTFLCEPPNATFQSWLTGISNLQSTDVICSPSLETNFVSGAPGSFFTITGTDFPANSTATIAVNAQELGTVTTDSDGNLTFLLSTTNADEGYYFATATVNPSAAIGFRLDSDEPVRPQDGSGLIIDVPAGIAFTEFIYLPIVIR